MAKSKIIDNKEKIYSVDSLLDCLNEREFEEIEKYVGIREHKAFGLEYFVLEALVTFSLDEIKENNMDFAIDFINIASKIFHN